MSINRDLANIISGGFTSADIPNLDASKITSGTIDNARITLDANEVPNIDASKIASGTISASRLGSGTADATTFLRGDNTFASAGGTNTPAFEAFLTTDQLVTDNVLTKVQFNTEVFDTDNCYDNSTNYRFTPNVAGKYFVYGSVTGFANSSSSIVHNYAIIYKNGSSVKFGMLDFRNSYAYHVITRVEGVIDMNGTTDYLELYGALDVTTGTPEFDGNSDGRTSFGAYKIIE